MAEGQDDAQEKTEEPTPRRREQAREKGQVPRSRELNTAVLMLATGGYVVLLGDGIVDGLAETARQQFDLPAEALGDPSVMTQHLGRSVFAALAALTPFFVISYLVAALSPMLLGGWSFSMASAAPKLDKISPIKGLQRVFGAQGLMEFVKAFAKFVLLSTGAALLIWYSLDELISLGREPGTRAIAHAGELLGEGFLLMSLGLLLIAAIDVPFQIWNHTRNLRMTHQEVRDESKETEGRPEVRAEIKKRQQEMAQGRMMQNVPDADVVVTNPTHYAVALKYSDDMRAPQVVAKGKDSVARSIRELAEAHSVPLFEEPTLARMLHETTELEQEIPARLYVAVAQVLAYVYRLDAARREGRAPPEPPADIDVPEWRDGI